MQTLRHTYTTLEVRDLGVFLNDISFQVYGDLEISTQFLQGGILLGIGKQEQFYDRKALIFGLQDGSISDFRLLFRALGLEGYDSSIVTEDLKNMILYTLLAGYNPHRTAFHKNEDDEVAYLLDTQKRVIERIIDDETNPKMQRLLREAIYHTQHAPRLAQRVLHAIKNVIR